MLRMIMLLLAAVLLGGLGACSDSSVPEPDPFAITGTVVDEAGMPVVGAAVLLDLDFVELVPFLADKPQTMIQFVLPDSAAFTLRITDACDDELFFERSDTSTEGGRYFVTWDGTDRENRLLAEGFFNAQLLIEGQEPVVHELAVGHNIGDEAGTYGLAECATVRESWRVAAWTDAAGRFRVQRDCWDFGRSTEMRDETGAVTGGLLVAPRVRVWAYPDGRIHGTASAWTDVSADTGADVAVRLPAP